MRLRKLEMNVSRVDVGMRVGEFVVRVKSYVSGAGSADVIKSN